MRIPSLPADFTHARPCKPFCEKSLTLPSDETFDNWSAILSIFIFYFCKKKFKEESIRPRLKKFILWFTPNILGVFLLSAQLLYIFLEIYSFSSRYLPAQLSCFIWVLFVIAISTIIISVLRKIPGVKKLL